MVKLALISVAAVAAGVGTWFAASPAEPPAKPAKPKTPMDRYLDAAIQTLLEDPTDERFGISRIPTVHNPNTNSPEANTAIADMQGRYFWTVRTYGNFQDNSPHRVRDLVMNGPRIWGENIEDWRKSNDQLVAEAKKLWKSKADRATAVVGEGDFKVTMISRKVSIPRESCLKCHTELKVGSPVGVVAMLYREKTDKPVPEKP